MFLCPRVKREWSLLNAKWAFFSYIMASIWWIRLDNENDVRFVLDQNALFLAHWDNSSREHMSLHSDTLPSHCSFFLMLRKDLERLDTTGARTRDPYRIQGEHPNNYTTDTVRVKGGVWQY
jgi:hypothetical protein